MTVHKTVEKKTSIHFSLLSEFGLTINGIGIYRKHGRVIIRWIHNFRNIYIYVVVSFFYDEKAHRQYDVGL